MDTKRLLATLEQGIEFVENLTPVLSAIPGAGPIIGTVVGVASAVTDVVTNVTNLVADGKIVADSDDEATLKTMLKRLQDQNDVLADYIDKS